MWQKHSTREASARELHTQAILGGCPSVCKNALHWTTAGTLCTGPSNALPPAHPSTVRHNGLAAGCLASVPNPGSPTIFPGPLPDLSWMPPRCLTRCPLGSAQDSGRTHSAFASWARGKFFTKGQMGAHVKKQRALLKNATDFSKEPTFFTKVFWLVQNDTEAQPWKTLLKKLTDFSKEPTFFTKVLRGHAFRHGVNSCGGVLGLSLIHI